MVLGLWVNLFYLGASSFTKGFVRCIQRLAGMGRAVVAL
jgi:hypothetical protein